MQNWVHPFVESLSDQIVGSLQEGAAWIRNMMVNRPTDIKGGESIHHAMQFYKDHQLEADLPMQMLLANNEQLQERVKSAGSTPTFL